MNLAVVQKVQASLPQTYEAARSALAQCQAIDECKDWADKAAALASYAKQADDLELEKMAIRIRARAMRRAGELAKQMMQPPHRPADKYDAGDILKSKAEVQKVSGFSERQLNTSLRVANVPQPEFDAQVDAANPATVTELARQGTQKRDPQPDPDTWLKGRDPVAFNKVLHMVGEIEDYAATAAAWDLETILPNLTDSDRVRLRRFIAAVDSIHDKIITRI
jgi:hypothetical protein